MPDETQPTGQAPTGQQPQAGNAATDQNTQTQQQSGSQTQQPQAGSSEPGGKPSMTLEEALAELARKDKELGDTRKEAAGYRTKAKDLDKRIADEEAAKLSETEREKKAREQAEAALTGARARIGKSELKLAAKEAGIIDPDDAIAHLGGKLEFDDDGEPKNVAELVAGLKQAKAHLFKSADGQSGTGAGQSGSGSQSGQNGGNGQRSASTSSGGATNPPRAGGPIQVTADQYLSKQFKDEFAAKHGMPLLKAIQAGKAQII